MKQTALALAFMMFFALGAGFGQRPSGPPQGRPGVPAPPRKPGQPPTGQRPEPGAWTRPHDTNNNGNLEASEFAAAVERTFAELDRDGSGSIEPGEAIRPRRPDQAGPVGARERGPNTRILPPFFFLDRVKDDQTFTRADFDRMVREVFVEMDGNGDGALSGPESKRVPRPPAGMPPRPDRPPMPPNARFVGAELRFGDKLVTGQPFSAEIIIQDTKRLFDGSTIVRESQGAIYRDSGGRTRREQPLDMVGGFSVVGQDGNPQKLVFINDPANKVQIFLDTNNRVARRSPLGRGPGPLEPKGPANAREESLGTRVIEGVSAEGTRTTFEIPAGEIGNTHALQVVTERWFSKELQILVLSRHLDPIAGEHVFKLVNIKRGEPSAVLFSIPTGFSIENAGPGRRN
ncbi:MAG: hypothetical protein AB7J13_09760 [Pyrinomonadaceae bacterium]